MRRLHRSIALLVAVGLAGASAVEASNFCERDGKKYSIGSTRCDGEVKLRCVAKDTWEPIGACPAAAPAKGPQFCRHGGKQYSIGSTRCEGEEKLRCVAAEAWESIGACKT